MSLSVVQVLAQCASARDGRTDAGAVREAVNRLLAHGYSRDAAMADAAAARRVGQAIRVCAARRAA